MKKGKTTPKAAGELRRSQVLTTYGPGSMVDLPRQAVVIGGLEHWHGDRDRIYEERFEAWIRDRLQLEEIALYAPPVPSDQPGQRAAGITAFQFPHWFLGQIDRTFTDNLGREYRTRPLIPYNRLIRGGYQDTSPKKKIRPVVPVRFVQACVRGHISDIDWYVFVRQDPETNRSGQLWLDEGGAGNDFRDIFVRCEVTKMRRPLSDASISKVLGRCSGRQPWLGPNMWEPCSKANRLLVRSASNAYYAETQRVISIPSQDAALREAVDLVYDDYLQYAVDAAEIHRERRKEKVSNALEGFDDDQVWAEVARRKRGLDAPEKGIKQAEIETLMSSREPLGEDRPDGDFYARSRDISGLPDWQKERIDRIILVHRLREVVAQLGFSRFDPAAFTSVDDELNLGTELAPLARDITWLPAVENRGEGIFLAFRDEAIQEWLERPAVREREKQLQAGFAAWCDRKNLENARFPGLTYIMLHSLSHLLITTLSLACGYAASSVRERLYTGEWGHGILLYTSSTGSEGTLGGLVDVGRNIEHHLSRALLSGRLCSNDPVCAQHKPSDIHEERFEHGAACHGCLLIAETCCEQRNHFLDRALVVPTVAGLGAEFFPIEDVLGQVLSAMESEPALSEV